MKKEKFIFNPNTLSYEKLESSIRKKVFKVFGLGSSAIVSGFLFFMLAGNFFPSPKEQALLRELDQMKFQFNQLNEQVDHMASVLSDLQYKDANVHRLVFGIDPIDSTMWNSGIGGHDVYQNITPFKNSFKVLKNSISKVNSLKSKIDIQKSSLDSLLFLAKDRETYFNSIPSIKPVQAGHNDKNIPYLSGYGMRMHPVFKIPRMHTGIDFGAPVGTPIRSAGDGKVIAINKESSGYGKHIIIDHGYGFKTLYAHLSGFDVKEGELVKKGQKIGAVGNSGTSTAPHLHYEVHVNDVPVNPVSYCLDGLSPEEYKELVNLASQENKSFD